LGAESLVIYRNRPYHLFRAPPIQCTATKGGNSQPSAHTPPPPQRLPPIKTSWSHTGSFLMSCVSPGSDWGQIDGLRVMREEEQCCPTFNGGINGLPCPLPKKWPSSPSIVKFSTVPFQPRTTAIVRVSIFGHVCKIFFVKLIP